MAMVCPKCKDTFEQRIYCPQCHVHLNYHQAKSGRGWFGGLGPWQHSALGRIAVGLVLAQGLYFALRQLFTAGALVTAAASADQIFKGIKGLIFLQTLQVVALLIGGMITGASKRHGFLYGAVLGVWNGIICILVYPPITDQALINAYSQPGLHAAFGAFGGWLGSFIWKPFIEPTTARTLYEKKEKKRRKDPARLWIGPLHWARVGIGSLFAIGGTMWAETILEVMESSGANIQINTHFQAQFVTWEITVLAMIGGAAVAGATTFNGLKQGLAVGVVTAVTLMGFRVGQGQATFLMLSLTAVSPLVLGMIGGVFGSQLLPPLAPKMEKKAWDIP